MMEKTIASPKMPAWLIQATSTVSRCHLIGSITTVTLFLCIALVWSYSRVDVGTIQYGGKQVDLRDAAGLIENAGRWRQLYTVNYQKSQAIDQRVESIRSWLPLSVDWTKTQRDIQGIGEATGVSIVTIKRGERHVGTRVGVVSASCEVQGSYVSLCHFLSELSRRPEPIACSEIKLDRTIQGDPIDDGSASPPCKATLSLRIPFGGAGAAAQRLLPTGTQNAS